MKITVTTAKSGRINIFSDGEYRFSIPSDVWFSSRFHDGDNITDEDLLTIKKTAGFSFAYDSALRMLGLRAHSKKELERKLSAKYGADETRSAIEKCEKYGFIDDETFALTFARELFERKNYAPTRIKNELRQRGISTENIEKAIEALECEDETGETGISAAVRKLRLPEELTEKEKARAYRRLLTLGYSYSEIRKALSDFSFHSVNDDLPPE